MRSLRAPQRIRLLRRLLLLLVILQPLDVRAWIISLYGTEDVVSASCTLAYVNAPVAHNQRAQVRRCQNVIMEGFLVHFPWLPTMTPATTARIKLLARATSSSTGGNICVRTSIGCYPSTSPFDARLLTFGPVLESVITGVPAASSNTSVRGVVDVILPTTSPGVGTLCGVLIQRRPATAGCAMDTLNDEVEIRAEAMTDALP